MTRRINNRKSIKPNESRNSEPEVEKEVPAAVEVEEMPEEMPELMPEDTPTSPTSRPRRVVRKNTLYHNADYDEELAAKEASEAPEKPPRLSTPRAPRPRAKSKPPPVVVKPMSLTNMLITSGPLDMSGPLEAKPRDMDLHEPATPKPKRKPAKRAPRSKSTGKTKTPKPAEKEATPELAEPAEPTEEGETSGPAEPAAEGAETSEPAGPADKAETSEPAKEAGTSEPTEGEETPKPAEKEKPSRKIKFHVPKVSRKSRTPGSRGKAKKEPKEEKPPTLTVEKETVLPSKLGKSVVKPPVPIPVNSEHHLVRGPKKRKIAYFAPEMMMEELDQAPPVLESVEEPAPKKPALSELAESKPELLEPAKSEPESSEPEQVHPKLDDIVYEDGADLVVGCDVEVELEDDGPPVLGPSVAINEERANEADDDEDYSDPNETLPPNLEKQANKNKKRGRPKVSKEEKEARGKQNREEARALRAAAAEKAKSVNMNQRYIKLFENEVGTTPEGDSYATVVGGCLTELLRKDRILDLLTNSAEIELIRQGGWLLERPPRLPPLSADKKCFAFYIDGSKIENPKDLSIDDLRPWSSGLDPMAPRIPAVKPNVRRHPVARLNGKLSMCKTDPRLAELHLTEYSARLPRDMRLRKKIFYLSRDNMIFGNVLILYDYTTIGIAPAVLNNPHGNDYLCNAMEDDALLLHDDGSPFEPLSCEGERGGVFLKLKSNKLGWVHNKHQVLDVLYNKPTLLQDLQVLNNRLPDLPPLIETVGVFVYFVPANLVINQIHHASDGLSPWTVIPGSASESHPPPRVRSSRRALELTTDGKISPSRDPRMQSDLILVETMSTLARCKRIRKRVIYIQQSSGTILGNVCYVYEFLVDGPIPDLITNINTKIYNRWKPKKEHRRELLPEDNIYDEDDYAMPMEEEIIVTVPLQQQVPEIEEEAVYDDIELVDTLRDGYDDQFGDDILEKAENPAPYYDQARQLEGGHIYLTVRHKKIAASFETVLEWIANTNTVEDRGILNTTKPGHPPLVSNARAYAFFVAGSAIFPHDINRDDFSPWSHNGNTRNPTCYRTKVRKIGVGCDPDENTFQLRDSDYKSCPFHLVYLYSINPRDPRMRKKIFYLMETQSKMIVSHALIIYDYNTEGDLPRLNVGQFKQFTKKNFVRPAMPLHDVMNDVSDVTEDEKECPFAMPPQEASDGTLYMELKDNEFWNDRNRQLHFLVNKPRLAQSLRCLNNKVPDLPPSCTGKGTFIFFVNGDEVNFRCLTSDRLAPWSENGGNSSTATLKRPKSAKTPLGINRENKLRVWRTNPLGNDAIRYQLHVYTATLPRCPRLRKKVVYVLKDGIQIGYAMIMYCFTEVGADPHPVNRPIEVSEHYLERFPLRIQTQVHEMLETATPIEIAKKIFDDHGIVINAHMLHYFRRQEIHAVAMHNAKYHRQFWTNADGAGPSTSAIVKDEEPVELSNSDLIMTDMVADGAMVVEHTEVIEQCMEEDVEPTVEPMVDPVVEDEPMHPSPEPPKPSLFLDKNMPVTGFVRGNQRYDALWRIAQKSFGTTTGHETFDELFRLLLQRNEARLLNQIEYTFKVRIVPSEVPLETDEEIVEEVMIPPVNPRRRI